MPIEPSLIAELAALGLLIGFVAGLLGIGGAMLIVPFVSIMLEARNVPAGLAMKMAIATSMATIIFTSISSVRAHRKRGAVSWRMVRGLAPGIVLGSMIASLGLFAILKGSTLALVFGVFVWFSATQMVLATRPPPNWHVPGTAGLLGAGGVIGLLAGLVGGGGAFVSVPFMTWCNVPIHRAIGTSAALGFPIALANVTGFVLAGQSANNLPPYSFGYVWIPALVAIASCSVLMAPLGARAAHLLPISKMQRVFAGALYLLGAYMIYKGLRTTGFL